MQLLNNIGYGLGSITGKVMNFIRVNPMSYDKKAFLVTVTTTKEWDKNNGKVEIHGNHVFVDTQTVGTISEQSSKMLEKSSRFGKKIVPNSVFTPTFSSKFYVITISIHK